MVAIAKQKGSLLVFLLSAFCSLLFIGAARANDLSVDRHTLRVGEAVNITLSLEDAFASLDDVDIPVRNLTLGPASMSSEFSWINGSVVRRKVFRYTARAIEAGSAQIGPLTITLPDGERDTFPAIALQVLADRAAGSNDPLVVLRELLAAGRDPFFVVADIDKANALVGEQVVVTWWLYNAATVQEWQIGAVPKLAEFWVEEVDVRSAQPVQTFVGDYVMQRMPIRRVALFPLRSGTLPIGSMEVEAAVMRRTTSGPFGLFEGNIVDVSFTSAPLSVAIHPLPPGASSLVGDLTLNCSTPRQKNGGPVLLDATLSGRGNIRSASAPRFESKPDADVQLVERGTSVERGNIPSMTRRWQFVMFPAKSGALAIPALIVPTFSPSLRANRTLRCDATTLTVSAADRAQSSAKQVQRSVATSNAQRLFRIIAISVVIALVVFVIGRVLARRRRVSANIRGLVSERSPSQIRDAIHERLSREGVDVTKLMRESSDRGDAYRALRSLLDALEHERINVDESEVRRRVRDLLESLQSAA